MLRKLLLREVKRLAQGHTSRLPSANLFSLTLGLGLLTSRVYCETSSPQKRLGWKASFHNHTKPWWAQRKFVFIRHFWNVDWDSSWIHYPPGHNQSINQSALIHSTNIFKGLMVPGLEISQGNESSDTNLFLQGSPIWHWVHLLWRLIFPHLIAQLQA